MQASTAPNLIGLSETRLDRVAQRSKVSLLTSFQGRWPIALASLGITTLFAMVYTLRIGMVAVESGNVFQWPTEFLKVIVHWWTSLLFVPALAWLVRTVPLARRRWIRNFFLLALGAAAASVGRALLDAPLAALLGESLPPLLRLTRVLAAFGSFLAIVGMLHAAYYYRQMVAREQEAHRLAQSLAAAELATAEANLSALRSQLHPHFLFNTINAVVALMHHEPWRADRMLTQLAELLRNMLRTPAAATHTLREELAVLNQYLDLMSVRFGERLTIHQRIDSQLLDVAVPWMVLQPIVENALEHGIWPGSAAGVLEVSTRQENANIVLVVDDNGVGLSHDFTSRLSTGTGLGLRNIRDRLVHLFGEKASLSIGPRSGGGTRVTIVLPMQPAS